MTGWSATFSACSSYGARCSAERPLHNSEDRFVIRLRATGSGSLRHSGSAISYLLISLPRSFLSAGAISAGIGPILASTSSLTLFFTASVNSTNFPVGLAGLTRFAGGSSMAQDPAIAVRRSRSR